MPAPPRTGTDPDCPPSLPCDNLSSAAGIFGRQEGGSVKAIRIHSLGGPEVLTWEDMPDPRPGEGQALVRVEASGVNFIDVYFRTGLYKGPALPFILGQEA